VSRFFVKQDDFCANIRAYLSKNQRSMAENMPQTATKLKLTDYNSGDVIGFVGEQSA